MEKVTNLDFIQKFSKGDMSRVKKYIMMYMQSADEEMPVIEKSFQDKDYKKLKTASHTLKSIAAYMGMEHAQQLLKKIEDSASNESVTEEMAHDITQLKEMITLSKDELKAFIAQN